MNIPNAKVGVIIGRGGDMIKNLQQRSGAKIQITRDSDADPTALTRDVELMGTQEQIRRAEELITEVIAETDAASSASSGNRGVAPVQPGSEQFVVKVPNDKVALVIGKGGETIKSMQTKTGARIQVVKQLWAYIKENDLQDPQNRRDIKCDQKLHSIFRVDTINMFKMNKVLSKHIWPLEADEEPSSNSPQVEKKHKRKKEEEVESKPKKRKEKKEKGGPSGILKPLELSEAFMKFIGTGETSLSREEAVKRMWKYIKENDLQDPSDKKIILCDEKLKELFDVDKFKGFAVTKYLTPHLIKKIEE